MNEFFVLSCLVAIIAVPSISVLGTLIFALREMRHDH